MHLVDISVVCVLQFMFDHPIIGPRLQQNLHSGQYQLNCGSLSVLSCAIAHKKSQCDVCCGASGAFDESDF